MIKCQYWEEPTLKLKKVIKLDSKVNIKNFVHLFVFKLINKKRKTKILVE